PGYSDEFGQLIGVETRTSSPVRVLREENTLEAAGLSNLFPCGEGSGYAGGIMSAALDGKRVAQAILAP
ncbi:MAG: FAD-binding protein, partial [Planctomycetes bacterium]|nr:FAD-binding protein [Planctomycetota bacterium]